jgi:hypothetical protein
VSNESLPLFSKVSETFRLTVGKKVPTMPKDLESKVRTNIKSYINE